MVQADHHRFVALIHLNMFYLRSLRSRAGVRSVCFTVWVSVGRAPHTQPEATVLTGWAAHDNEANPGILHPPKNQRWSSIRTRGTALWCKIISPPQIKCFISNKRPGCSADSSVVSLRKRKKTKHLLAAQTPTSLRVISVHLFNLCYEFMHLYGVIGTFCPHTEHFSCAYLFNLIICIILYGTKTPGAISTQLLKFRSLLSCSDALF